MRHSHGFRFGQGDLYVLVKMLAKDSTITLDTHELLDATWMTPEQIKAAQQAKRARKAAALAASGGLPTKKPARPLKRLKKGRTENSDVTTDVNIAEIKAERDAVSCSGRSPGIAAD